MNEIVYNVPLDLMPAYRERATIVRSNDADSLVRALPEIDGDQVVAVQLLSLSTDVDAMADWGYAMPVELVMLDPEAEFALLYRYAKLLDQHPVRVSIPVVPGLSKAVKVAAALRFVVKLEPDQPLSAGIAEMHEVLDYYLHLSSVLQPIEFFHRLLQAFYYLDPVTLWEIQEEDPAYLRYVTEDGVEIAGRRIGSQNLNREPGLFVDAFKSQLLAERGECYECEFFENCGGYFKWPNKEYRCDGIKQIFAGLREAAAELIRHLAAFEQSEMEAEP